jgi:hypothetical protein
MATPATCGDDGLLTSTTVSESLSIDVTYAKEPLTATLNGCGDMCMCNLE